MLLRAVTSCHKLCVLLQAAASCCRLLPQPQLFQHVRALCLPHARSLPRSALTGRQPVVKVHEPFKPRTVCQSLHGKVRERHGAEASGSRLAPPEQRGLMPEQKAAAQRHGSP